MLRYLAPSIPSLITLSYAQHRYSDLECDYINPIDLCNRLNTYIIPEAAVHAVLTALFLVNGYWVALILNLPLVAFNVKKYVVFPEIAGGHVFVWFGRRLANRFFLEESLITHICSTPPRFSGL